MNSQDWEKIQKNWVELIDVYPHPIISFLYQENVLTTIDKSIIEKHKVREKQMECLMETLKGKPASKDAFKYFIEALNLDPVTKLIADKVIQTESKSDPGLRSKPNPHLLNEKVRKVLHENYASVENEAVPVDEVRKLLKTKKVFDGKNDWDNNILIDFIKKTFMRVEIKKEKKRTGSNRQTVSYLTNIGKVELAPKGQSLCQQNDPREHDNSSGPNGESQKLKNVADMSTKELKDFLTIQFDKEGQPKDFLDILEAENISGKIFLTMKEEDFKDVLPNATFGVRRYLTILCAELSHPIRDYPVYLRKFDSPVTHTDKYHKGHCADISVNVRGRRTDPIRNVHLVEATDVKIALEFIAFEAIPFISACLNDRRNGTIYFGISPLSDKKFKFGEIVGVNLTKKDVQEKIQEVLKGSFTESQKDIICSTVREALFIPVIGTEQSLFVIELDVVPSSALMLEVIVRTKEPFLPDRFLRNHKGKDSVVFRFSEEGFPKIVSSEELCQYEQVQPRIIEERKQEESHVNVKTGQNLRLKLLNLLTGGSEVIYDTIFPFLMTSPLDELLTQDYLKEKISFIKHLNPHVVFDFDDKGTNEGLLQTLEEHYEVSSRILTTSDFDENVTKIDDYKEFIASLKQEIKTAWLFCNGYNEQSIPAFDPIKWNKERSDSFQKALKFFMDFFEKERIIIIICLFSQNYLTMIEACDELLKKLPENWIVLAETEDIAKLWQDQILSRNKATKSDLLDRCVIGLRWDQVDKIIGRAANSDISHGCSVPSSTGDLVEIREKKLNDWCDISVLSSSNFDVNTLENEEGKFRKDIEERFYRGDQVDWWNFAFQDQVLRRHIHSNLLQTTRLALEGRIRESHEKVNVVPILHQPGAGGTTSAKQVLWDLRKEYRCCVVDRITNQTCDQLDAFRQYKDTNPKPILILVDNQEKFDQLKEHQEELVREKLSSGNELFQVYCTIILCIRRTSLPPQLKIDQVALYQELLTNEVEWFTNKHQMLMQKYKKNKEINVNPEFLIAFNILRHNFNKEYISNVVTAFIKDIKSDKEVKILKIVALLNAFDSDFKAIPVSCFNIFLSDCSGDKMGNKQGTRSVNWEGTLTQGIKVLLNLSSNRKRENRGSQNLKVFSKVIAEEILLKMKDRTGQTVSEIMFELLNQNIFNRSASDFNVLQSIINNIFKKRERHRNSLKKFSDFILHIESNENAETVCRLLECLFSHNFDAFTAQLVARYYIHIKSWEQAEKFAKCATDIVSDNSCLWHTYGQVFKSQLFEYISAEKGLIEGQTLKEQDINQLINLGQKSIWAFRNGQAFCELEPSSNEESNLAVYFGELEVIALILSALELSSLFKDRDQLHSYLVYQPYMPPEVSFLFEEEHTFLKGLEICSIEVMRLLDDEFLQLIKRKAYYTTDHQDYNRKSLISLKVSLDVFFGESTNQIPMSFNERDRCEYNLRRARYLGASSLKSLLELKNNGRREELDEIYQLLEMNILSSERNFDDLRSMLEIVTVFLLNGSQNVRITFENILECSKCMYLLGKQRQISRSHLEMYLYYVLYNFPTQERVRFSLSMNVDLLSAIQEWKIAYKKNHPKSTKHNKGKETIVFFLGQGQPLHDIVFFDKTEVLKMYTVPRFRNNLRIFTGVLAEGGHEVILQVKGQVNSSFSLTVPMASTIKRNEMFKRSLCVYLGFSYSGPKAFYMIPEEAHSLQKPIHYAKAQTNNWQQRGRPESLAQLIDRSKRNMIELKNLQLPMDRRAHLLDEQDQLRHQIRILLGEFFP